MPAQSDAVDETDHRSTIGAGGEPDNGGALWVSLLAALAVVLVGILSLLPALTPAPLPTHTPATVFSADRAMVHARMIAQSPRPTGSPRQAVVRQYLIDTLAELGLTVDLVQRDTCRDAGRSSTACGHVVDLRTVVPGADRSSAVVLVAHYDSIAGGPGASDDAYAVSSILEIARVLRAGPQLRNDVVLLLTDGEEAGLLGAQAAVDAGLLPDPARTVVLNVEARGNRAPFVMFETNGGVAGLVGALRDDPAHATSLAASVYGMLSSDTDFSVFRAAGYPGMGFAVIGGAAVYDTAVDTVERADPRTVQAMGNALLATTRRLAEADLPEVIGSGPATYFPLLGFLVSYPPAVDVAVTAVAAVLVAVAMVGQRRRGMLSLRRLLVGVAATVLLLLTAIGLGLLCWQLALQVRPDYIGLLSGTPYRAWLTALGCVVVLAAGTAAWHAFVRYRVRGVELAGGVVIVFTAGAAVISFFSPVALYLLSWPALAGAAVLLGVVAVPRLNRWFVPLWAVPAAIAIALLVPIAYLLFVAVGLALVAVPLVVVASALAFALAATPPARRWVSIATVLLVGGVLAFGGGLAVDASDRDHPRQFPFAYALDIDSGKAVWLTPFPVPDPFLDNYVTEPSRPWSDEFPLLFAPKYRFGPARVAPVAVPIAALVTSAVADNMRSVRVRVSVADPAAALVAVYVDTVATPVIVATAAGRPVPGSDARSESGPWGWAVTRVGGLAEGWDLELRVRGTGPIRLRLLTQAPGVPASALDMPLPDDATGGIYPSMQTIGARTVVI